MGGGLGGRRDRCASGSIVGGIGGGWNRDGSGRLGTLIIGLVVVRGRICFSGNAELAVKTLDDFAGDIAGDIAVDLEVLDRDVQAFECVAEVKARSVELSDILVGEGESERKVEQSAFVLRKKSQPRLT